MPDAILYSYTDLLNFVYLFDIQAERLRIRDNMKFRPIRENTKVDQIVISELIQQLNGNIKQHVLSLQDEKLVFVISHPL